MTTREESKMFEYQVKNGVTTLETNNKLLTVSTDPLKGFKPIELLISSIVGCSSGIFSKVLEKKRIEVSNIRVKANVERNPEEANKVTRIDLHFIVEGENISEEQIRKTLEVTIKNCGMIQTVIGSVEIHESYEIING
jgi:uncharacterized OsmC-like protein